MRKINRPRLHASIGYYGFGNIAAVFNRRPKPIFDKIKTIYGEELERYDLDYGNGYAGTINMSKEELDGIRTNIRLTIRKENRKDFLSKAFVLAAIGIALLFAYNML